MKNISARIAELSPEKRELLALLLDKEKAAESGAAIRPRVRVPGEPLPLSFAQQRLWFLDQLEPGTPFYNIPAAVRLRGRLDTSALERAFAELARRHESLRTTFVVVGDEPAQVVAPDSGLRLQLEDLTRLSAAEREAEVTRLAAEEAQEPFDLAAGPLLRLRALRLSDEEHVLLLTMHHIISDGWSMGVLIREVAALYDAFTRGEPSPLPELPIQYADFAAWQREHLTDEVMGRQLSYWRERLAGAEPLELPADRPRPAVRSHRGAGLALTLDAGLTRRLRELSRREGVTLFMTMLAALDVLLSRYSGQTDISVGTPIANRNLAETEGLIGFFVNTLVMRAEVSPDLTFSGLLGRVRETALGAYANQDVPFERLVEELQPRRDLSQSPLFQVLFVMQNAPSRPPGPARLDFEMVDAEVRVSTFDLGLVVSESAETINVVLSGSLDLFDHETLARIGEHYEALLEAAAADPARKVSDLPLVSERERRRLLVEWNDTRRESPTALLIHQMFEARAAETPDAVAVLQGGARLGYGELDRRANRLAHRLRRAGVGPEERVVILMERSPEMIVAVLGVLKAGGAYVPLDAGLPAARVAFVLRDTRAKAVLTQRKLSDALPPADGVEVICLDARCEEVDGEDAAPLACEVTPESLAYVIYTSGSTGEPKGVMVQHGSIKNYVEESLEVFGLGPSDRVLQFASLSFDTSAEEIYPTLAAGATLVLRDDAMLASARTFLGACREWGVTVLDLPTAYWHELAADLSGEHEGLLAGVRLVIIGGEKALARRLESWGRHAASVRLFNGYGPTETTVVVIACDVDAGTDPSSEIPIGRPVRNVRAYVLDARLQPAPVGVPGELYIGGAALARGYLGRPALTAERFVPDPYSGEPGARLYRTGDLVKRRADGMLEYVGRADRQVKLRGYRIELGEVESALLAHPAVREAAAVAREDAPGEKRLVAYVVAREGAELPDAGGWREHLRERLPGYMLPQAFVALDELPLSSSGKVDRRRLPAPERDAAAHADDYAAPRTPLEEMLAGVYSDLLGVGRVGREDDFFDLGGHSLLATRLIARARSLLSIELPLRAVFEAPTVAGLAARVEAIQSEGRAGLLRPPLTAQPRGPAAPLSFAQQRLWFLDQLEPGTPLYNVSAAVRLAGRLDAEALERAFAELARRHESLRTTFAVVEGEPAQVVAPPTESRLPFVDLSGLPEGEREAEARRLAAEEAAHPFDLAAGPVARTLLLRLSDDEHVAVLTMHHIVCDAWSVEVLVREVGALYRAFSRGEPSPLPELPVQYADFAAWQRGWLRGAALAEELAYWTRRLEGAPPLELPTDRPRPAVQTYNGATHDFELSADSAAALRAVGREAGTTPFMTVLAAFKALLSRYTGQADVVVGTPVANRGQAETENLIGFFLNTLVLRTDLSGDPTFRELLGRVRETALGAYTHQDVPFEKLVEEIHPARDLSRSPLFQVMFILENASGGEGAELALPGLKMSAFALGGGTAKFDLTLSIKALRHGWHCRVEYNTDLFDARTIESLAAHFRKLLEGAAAAPERRLSELPLLSAEEERRLLVEFNRTGRDYPRDILLHELFERQAARTPDATALVFDGERLTYRELDERANRFAHHLQGLGVGPDERGGVLLDRGAELVVALLAVMKAGGAYVPLDPAYPRERLAFMLEDAGAKVLLTSGSLAEGVPVGGAAVVRLEEVGTEVARRPSDTPARRATPRNLAYLIYTSGSTGRPKAVAIEHHSAATLCHWAAESFADEELAGVLASTSVCFDLSVFELFVPLSRGGSVILAENALALPVLPAASEVTLVNTVPSAMAALVRQGGTPASLKVVNLAGEALKRSLVEAVYETTGAARVLNLYGPSEDTTYSTFTEVERGVRAEPTIGRPIANTRVYVVDGHARPVPVGVHGELLIGGEGLARGYLGRPALTAERFVPDPYSGEPGARLYRTGDLARFLPDGELEYLGRLDHQVKVRGFRVELGEVEAALLRHPSVAEAVVVAREAAGGDLRLVAYVAGGGVVVAPAAELRALLKESLPEHMIPSAFVTLESLPLTPNGKIDRKALPAPEQSRDELGATYIAPRTAVEKVLAGIWSEVLGLERVGVADNFFDLGGHSLLATQVVARVREAFEVELPLRRLFEEPTVAGLADVCLGEPVQRARVEKTAELLLMLEGLSEDEAEGMLTEGDVLTPEGRAE
jgi:amino acid adenylation domain-containing protein